jgi:acetyl-CoA C-acetyltransferase
VLGWFPTTYAEGDVVVRTKEVVICSPVRTPIGTYGGSLKDTTAVDLGATVVRATIERAKVAPADIGTVVMVM